MKIKQKVGAGVHTRSDHRGPWPGAGVNRIGGKIPAPKMPAPPKGRAHGANPWSWETDPPDSIVARRNVLTAMWAGRLMGLADADLATYAGDARFLSRSDAKIVRMILEDLTRKGHIVSANEVQQALSRFHRIALHQSCFTD